MKFACENCGTRYTLSDEKVRNRLLKIRCKICENVIVISGQAQSMLGEKSAPPAPAEIEWFCSRAGGDPDGPMPEERLRERVRQGELSGDDQVWSESLSRWTPVRDVAALRGLLRPAGPPRPPALPPALAARAARSRGIPEPIITGSEKTEAAESPVISDSSDVPASAPLASIEALLAEAERPSGGWSGRERDTLAVSPPASLLEAAAGPALAADTVQLEALPPTENPAALDTALAPILPMEDPNRTTALVEMISTPPTPRPAPQAPISAPPAPMAVFSVPLPPPAAPLRETPVVPQPAVSVEPEAPAQDSRALDARFFGDERLALAEGPQDASPRGGVAEGEAGGRPATPAKAPKEPKKDALDDLDVPRSSSRLGLVIGGLLLLGGGLGLGLYFGRSPQIPAAPDATLATVQAPVTAAAPILDAALPDAALPDAALPDAALPDAAVPDAAPPSVAQRPLRPRVAPPSAAPATEPASGALAALDRGRVEAPVEVPVENVPAANLPDTLEQAAIVSVIKGHQRGVHGCYQRQLKRDASMRQANVKLAFSIERSGQTSNVRIDDKYNGTELAACLDRLVRRWRFPAFKGEAIPVEYPLIFTASL